MSLFFIDAYVTGTERTVIFGVYPRAVRISLAIAVVEVMSVHPTSENLTVLQLSGSPAKAALAPASASAPDSARTVETLIVYLPEMRGPSPPQPQIAGEYRREARPGQIQ